MALIGIAVVVGAVVLGIALLGGDDDQSKVEARAGDPLPDVAGLNREDDAGADVVRAYLEAALSCSPSGEALMRRLSRSGESGAAEVVRTACARSGGRPPADRVEAKLVPDELDEMGRALWRVEASDGALPADLILRVRQGSRGWEIERSCIRACPP
ncbi:MAG: hypothetical protein ACRDKY_13300 [Solirubrobacteraceae bacterium]